MIIFLFNSTQIYGYIKAPSCINKYDHNSYLKDNETFENVISIQLSATLTFPTLLA